MNPDKLDKPTDTETIARAITKANEKTGMLTANTLLTGVTAVFVGLLAWVGERAVTKLDELNTAVLQMSVQVTELKEASKSQADELKDHDQKISVLWSKQFFTARPPMIDKK